MHKKTHVILFILLAGFLLGITLSPFRFALTTENIRITTYIPPLDAVSNIILFIPLGMVLGFAGAQLGPTLIAGSVVSLSIELLQLTTPRITSIFDWLFNTAGTGVGCFIWYYLVKKNISHLKVFNIFCMPVIWIVALRRPWLWSYGLDVIPLLCISMANAWTATSINRKMIDKDFIEKNASSFIWLGLLVAPFTYFAPIAFLFGLTSIWLSDHLKPSKIVPFFIFSISIIIGRWSVEYIYTISGHGRNLVGLYLMEIIVLGISMGLFAYFLRNKTLLSTSADLSVPPDNVKTELHK